MQSWFVNSFLKPIEILLHAMQFISIVCLLTIFCVRTGPNSTDWRLIVALTILQVCVLSMVVCIRKRMLFWWCVEISPVPSFWRNNKAGYLRWRGTGAVTQKNNRYFLFKTDRLWGFSFRIAAKSTDLVVKWRIWWNISKRVRWRLLHTVHLHTYLRSKTDTTNILPSNLKTLH